MATNNQTTIGIFSLADHLRDPVTGRQVEPAERLRDLIRQCEVAEAVGFERFAVGEHHFSDYILPNANLILAAAAARTKRIRLFTSVTLLACRDAVQLAEDIGVLDALSNGRLELSFARGVSFDGAELFGVTPDNVYTLMGEKLEALLALFGSGRLERAGEKPDLLVHPRPVQKPFPPLWMGGGLSNASCDLAITHGLPLILPSLFRYPVDYLPMVERYRNGMAEAGKSHLAKLSMPNYCWVAKTSQEAKRNWQPRLEHYVDFASNVRKGFGRAMDFESLLEGPAICGSPAEVVDRMGEINELLGLDNHIVLMDVGGMPFGELQDAMELMGNDVLPHFHTLTESAG